MREVSIAEKNNDTRPHGHCEWLTERILAAISLPLVMWFLYSMVSFSNGSYSNFGEFIGLTINKVLLLALIAIFLTYVTLALKVVYEDYITTASRRHCMIRFTTFISIIAFIVAIVSILKIGG